MHHGLRPAVLPRGLHLALVMSLASQRMGAAHGDPRPPTMYVRQHLATVSLMRSRLLLTEIHRDEFLEDWSRLQTGRPPFKIEPLR